MNPPEWMITRMTVQEQRHLHRRQRPSRRQRALHRRLPLSAMALCMSRRRRDRRDPRLRRSPATAKSAMDEGSADDDDGLNPWGDPIEVDVCTRLPDLPHPRLQLHFVSQILVRLRKM